MKEVIAVTEKNVEKTAENTFMIGMLYDFYSELLTPRQKEVMQFYYEENYSLSEIAEELGVSRQAVHDTIHKAERSLRSYEEKLGIVEKFRRTEADIEKAVAVIDRITDQLNDQIKTGGIKDENGTVEKLKAVKHILSRLEE